ADGGHKVIRRTECLIGTGIHFPNFLQYIIAKKEMIIRGIERHTRRLIGKIVPCGAGRIRGKGGIRVDQIPRRSCLEHIFARKELRHFFYFTVNNHQMTGGSPVRESRRIGAIGRPCRRVNRSHECGPLKRIGKHIRRREESSQHNEDKSKWEDEEPVNYRAIQWIVRSGTCGSGSISVSTARSAISTVNIRPKNSS